MADVDLAIGGRRYTIACRDGGEDHLRGLAMHVDRKAQDARAAVGDVNEVRQLLFAALLLADELAEARAAPVSAQPPLAPDASRALTSLADRVEAVAEALERRAASA